MALQLILGGAGSGKSEYLYQDIIQKSIKYPENNYIIIVPEQYTMETQKKLVRSHPRKGILNIDVVSFERLAYKIFEEVGGQNRPVLDDTGKNLIVRRVLENNKKNLGYFGNSMNKTGFVSELKSVISEMLQYDINEEKLQQISEKAKESGQNGQLTAKLEDIRVIYTAFKDYIKDNYITSEEILDVLCSVISRSNLIKNSELVFDGFTGFTPIQYKLLGLLLQESRDIQVSVTIDAKEKVQVYEGMQNLFFMSKDMIQKLYRLCDELHVEIKDNIFLDHKVNPRFLKAPELSFLEKNLFRYTKNHYENKPEKIQLYEAKVPKEEIQYTISEILRLTRKEGYRYRDIAIVTGDIASYGRLAGNMLNQNDIPCFIDMKRPITDNPFVEMVRSALEIIEKGYSYDSVFRYLRTGMTNLNRKQIDILENYCLATGVRGSKQWHEPWTRRTRNKLDTDLSILNEMRERIIKPLLPLEQCLKDQESCVRDYVTAVYEYIVAMDSQEKITQLSQLPVTGNEYDQLYAKVIDLLDKIVELLGEEKVTVKEFNRIVDAGFEEIKVGLIPPSADCVVVGDIERTRLDNIKVLFFLGVNDGIVPKKSENKSILSEMDRDTLTQMEVVLSPSVREKAFIQKFYLYLILTKASDKLYVLYSIKGSDGKSLLPSYLIGSMMRMFPYMNVYSKDLVQDQLSYIRIPKSDICWNEENYIQTLSENVAMNLYGQEMTGSITAFESFASCRFAYYLQYGLKLLEREEYRFAMNDFGTVLHAVLEDVSKCLEAEQKSFYLLTDEERRAYVVESILKVTNEYGNQILTETSRNEFMIKRMTDLADRAIWAIGKQLACGEFKPDAYECKFLMNGADIDPMNRLSIQGKIDRIDICEDEENVYVKIVDYKSNKSDFNLLKTYYGLKLQLITYMKAAMKIEGKRHPGKNIIPAGILYFNIEDPLIDVSEGNEDDEQVKLKIQEALRMKGVVNANKQIVKRMDSTEDKSLSIPVAFKKDGEFDERRSKLMTTDQFSELETFVVKKSVNMADAIFQGNIGINPYENGNRNSCEYCPYNAICGFSPDISKTTFRHIKKFEDEQLWNNIREGVDENGKHLD
jgi:ATP-dependent helicase/nuclease subunit B